LQFENAIAPPGVSAADGQGKDAHKLNDEERARLRPQALDWLRADLAAWARVTDRTLVLRTLKRWRQDADLTSVRDPEGLAKLPQAEREAWCQLWSDVADLLQKTGDQK
jgi:hypothetical protein